MQGPFADRKNKLFSGRIDFSSGQSSRWVMPWVEDASSHPLSSEFIARDVASFFPKLYNLNNPKVVFLITGSADLDRITGIDFLKDVRGEKRKKK